MKESEIGAKREKKEGNWKKRKEIEENRKEYDRRGIGRKRGRWRLREVYGRKVMEWKKENKRGK